MVNGSVITTSLLLVTACLAIAAWAVSSYSNRTLSLWPTAASGALMLAFIFITFPYAALRVAHKERLARIDAEARLDQSRPKFVGRIKEFGNGTVPMVDQRLALMFWIELENLGSPSRTKLWSASLRGHDGSVIPCDPPMDRLGAFFQTVPKLASWV